jgi:intracellular sulfur oxidation DsrE/DsrF family protein
MNKMKWFFSFAGVLIIAAALGYAAHAYTTNWRGKAPTSHPDTWYGWHTVKGARKYFPNLATIPPFTMGAPPVPGKIYHALFIISANNKIKMNKIIDNIHNALNDPRLKGHIKIELLAFSAGSHLYFKGSGREKALLKLKKMGVELAQCANSLYELHIPISKLYPFIKIVPSAQGEIILRESEGYAYLKP